MLVESRLDFTCQEVSRWRCSKWHARQSTQDPSRQPSKASEYVPLNDSLVMSEKKAPAVVVTDTCVY